MNFDALCLGESVPQKFSARVHSAFRAALNLRYRDTLLTLTAADQDDLPQGIRVRASAGFSFERFNLGDAALCDGEFLRLPALTIDLRRAPRWTCNLSALQADFSSDAFSRAWTIAWDALNERQRAFRADIVADELLHPQESSNAICKRAGSALRALMDSARRNDSADLTFALKKLIGLGAGLTPSGDDVLVGFFAGLFLRPSVRADFANALAREAVRLSSATNEISRVYLFHAAHGRVSRRLANLAAALCAPSAPVDLLAALRAAAQTGHSSGMDAISGLLLGMAD